MTVYGESEIEYEVYGMDNGQYLFHVYGNKLPRQRIINTLKEKGYYKGLYKVEWRREYGVNTRSGTMEEHRTKRTIIDPEMSAKENASTFKTTTSSQSRRA